MKKFNFIQNFKKKFIHSVNLRNLNLPMVFKEDSKFLQKALREKELSTYGKYTKIFEDTLRKYVKSKYVLATINGSAAMQIAMIAAGIRRNDEILMPSFNYISNANAANNCGAIPHFIDCEEATLGICPKKLNDYLKKNSKLIGKNLINKKTKRVIRAIVPVYIFGHPPKMKELMVIARKFNLLVLEDAAEALGSFYSGKHAGTFGQIGTLSFNGNKIVTTGGGGAVLTNSKKLYEKMKKIVSNGRKFHRWKLIFDEIGYNYRLPSLNSAIGISQIKNLNIILKKNRSLYNEYNRFFTTTDGIIVKKEPKFCKSNYWLQTLILGKNLKSKRDTIIKKFIKNKVEVRAAWDLLSETKMYKNCPSMNLENSKDLISRIINIPSRKN
mgnify:CR=1 FL=1